MRVVLSSLVNKGPTCDLVILAPVLTSSSYRLLPTPSFSEHFLKLSCPCPSISLVGKRSLRQPCSLSLRISRRYRALLLLRRPSSHTPGFPPMLPQLRFLPPPLPSTPNPTSKHGGRYSRCIWKRRSFKAIRSGSEVSATSTMRRLDSLHFRPPCGSDHPRVV